MPAIIAEFDVTLVGNDEGDVMFVVDDDVDDVVGNGADVSLNTCLRFV